MLIRAGLTHEQSPQLVLLRGLGLQLPEMIGAKRAYVSHHPAYSSGLIHVAEGVLRTSKGHAPMYKCCSSHCFCHIC